MQGSRFSLFTLFFFSLILSVGHSDLNGQVVTYSFKDQKFAERLPIDENFTIKFTDIRPRVNRIEVRIWNTSKAHSIQRGIKRNERKLSRCDEWSDRGNDILAKKRLLGTLTRKEYCETLEPTFTISNPTILDHWKTPPHIYGHAKFPVGSQVWTISFASKLEPNNSYYIEIDDGSVSPLSAAQKIEVANRLNTEPDLLNVMNDLFRHQMKAGSLNYGFLSDKFRPMLFDAVSAFLARYYPTFRVESIDPASTHRTLNNGLISSHLGQMHSAYEGLHTTAVDELGMSEKDFALVMNNIDLSSLTNTSASYATVIDSLKHAFEKRNPAGDFAATFQPAVERNLDRIVTNKTALLPLITEFIVEEFIVSFSALNQTFYTDVIENSKRYIFADAGYGYAEDVHHFGQALLSIHLRPINESIPPKHYSGLDRLLTRCSFVIGGTVAANFQSTELKGIINDRQAVLLGLGLRVVPGVKIHGGRAFYYRIPSPVVPKQNLKSGWFLSIGLDFNVQPSFKSAFNKL